MVIVSLRGGSGDLIAPFSCKERAFADSKLSLRASGLGGGAAERRLSVGEHRAADGAALLAGISAAQPPPPLLRLCSGVVLKQCSYGACHINLQLMFFGARGEDLERPNGWRLCTWEGGGGAPVFGLRERLRLRVLEPRADWTWAGPLLRLRLRDESKMPNRLEVGKVGQLPTPVSSRGGP